MCPSRRVEIATSAGRVSAPNRAATLYEYNKKASVPTDMPLDNGISLLEEYGSTGGGPDKAAVLSSFPRVHELESSTGEFGRLGEWIDKKETAEYVRERPLLKSAPDGMDRRRRKGR